MAGSGATTQPGTGTELPLSIVIPAYNEQGRLPGTLPRIQRS